MQSMKNDSPDPLKLTDGSTVIIAGGGPAGSACALKLVQLSRERDLSLKIVLFEEKDFITRYNHCAGVLSPPLTSVLGEELGIEVPQSLFSRKIFGYRLHVSDSGILLVGEDRKGPTFTINRVDLDRYLLDCCRTAGVTVIPDRITGIEFVKDGNIDGVRVTSRTCSLVGDVFVGAFGSDAKSMDMLAHATSRLGPYRSPARFLRTVITRLPTEQGFIEKKLGNIIYAFLAPRNISGIEFGAITPKKDHILINIAGENVLADDMNAFLEFAPVKNYISTVAPKVGDYYSSRFPASPALHPFGRRYVTLGDATGWLRPLKGKGINLAINTGIRAAKTMISCGVSKESFSKYARDCREFQDDFYYGMFVRFVCKRFPHLVLKPFVNLARIDPFLYEALFLSVSGHDTFKNILKSMFSLKNMGRRTGLFLKDLGERSMKHINIRPLNVRDIDALMKIDEKITGKPHTSFWESKVASYLEREPGACLAAVVDDRVVGFILGDIRGWEFAIPLTGWIEVIGVDKDYQGKGIGRALIDALIEYFRQNNIEFVQAMINWNDGDLIDYLRSMGFERGEYINLLKKL